MLHTGVPLYNRRREMVGHIVQIDYACEPNIAYERFADVYGVPKVSIQVQALFGVRLQKTKRYGWELRPPRKRRTRRAK